MNHAFAWIAKPRKDDEMARLLPTDIEDFLADLGAARYSNPKAFLEFAQPAAALLFEKYVILQDPTLDIMPAPLRGRWWNRLSERPKNS
jgi:hypothetical protein